MITLEFDKETVFHRLGVTIVHLSHCHTGAMNLYVCGSTLNCGGIWKDLREDALWIKDTDSDVAHRSPLVGTICIKAVILTCQAQYTAALLWKCRSMLFLQERRK